MDGNVQFLTTPSQVQIISIDNEYLSLDFHLEQSIAIDRQGYEHTVKPYLRKCLGKFNINPTANIERQILQYGFQTIKEQDQQNRSKIVSSINLNYTPC